MHDPRWWVGKRVNTNPQGGRDFTRDTRMLRRKGEGVVTGYSNAHGLCYWVQHEDKALEACYDPDEITEIPESVRPTIWDRLKDDFPV